MSDNAAVARRPQRGLRQDLFRSVDSVVWKARPRAPLQAHFWIGKDYVEKPPRPTALDEAAVLPGAGLPSDGGRPAKLATALP